MIINVEAQRSGEVEYEILNRAIFYTSRMISSQKERDFRNSNYNDIKCVYSIWICMNWKENCMNHFHLADDPIIGTYEWKGNRELVNIVMIGLGKELPEHDEKYELHRLLGALLSKKLTIEEKTDIIEEYKIPMEQELEKEVKFMGSLSQGIFEEGVVEGEAEIIRKFYQKGFSIEQIAAITEKTEENVKAMIEERELELV